MSQATTSPALDRVLHEIDENFDRSVQRLSDLLRIPSVSTDTKYKDDVRRAAQWCADQLKGIGFDAQVHDTPGQPMVVAHHKGDAEAPRVLYYGHYDVQPPDPMNLWKSPPFEPSIEKSVHGKKIVARGAVDDKGQLMTFIEAFRAWKLTHGSIPFPVTILLEGEEESGSPSLEAFLKSHKKDLAADVCIVCDTGMWDVNTPAITYMLRGLLYTEVTLHGPSHDLHSGMYGGSLMNPINGLVRVLAQLHDNEGRIQVPGFYDDVRELGDAEAKQWKELGFDEKEFLDSAGVKTPFGEKGRTTLERTWSRPTCDINGIYGGYIGEGAKTVIASHATAKVSFRLVADQDPQKILAGFKKFLDDRTPPDGKWEIKTHGASPAIRVPTESPYLEAARKGLETVFNKKAVLIGTGGSIPLVGYIQKILGFDSLLVGFGLDDDAVHSPNEKFELKCYQNGIRSHAAIISELSKM